MPQIYSKKKKKTIDFSSFKIFNFFQKTKNLRIVGTIEDNDNK